VHAERGSWFVIFGVGIVFALGASADQYGRISETPRHTDTHYKLPSRPLEAAIDLTTFPEITIDPTALTEKQHLVLLALQNNREVPFDILTQAWIEHHTNAYNKKHGTHYSTAFVKNLLKAVGQTSGPPSLDPFEFKEAVDDRLQLAAHSAPLLYNVSAANPLEPLLNNQTQCASGSVCYSMAARLAWGSKLYRQKRPLFAYRLGHFQPSFILEDERNQTHLVGVETTASGGARMWLGEMNDLPNAPHALRLVDAELYPILEIFSSRLSETDRDKLAQWLQAQTAKRYGLELTRMEARVRDEVNEQTARGVHGNQEVEGPLAFGVSEARAGSQPRKFLPGSLHDADPRRRRSPLVMSDRKNGGRVAPASSTGIGNELTVIALSGGTTGLSADDARRLLEKLQSEVPATFGMQTREQREAWVRTHYSGFDRLPSRVRDILVSELVRTANGK